MEFAVIETGGKQYKVSAGQKIKVEKIKTSAKGEARQVRQEGEIFVFDKVLLVSEGDKTEVGAPHIDGAKVEAKILKNSRDKKKIVFKYHSKTRYRKKKGHRQHFTEVEITKIT
ncbi:MAG: 50S ribosomal protein L21 [Patescibacteria group bacterium]